MTNIAAINGAAMPLVPQGSGQNQLDQTAFLRLMTTQLNAQDPFNPMDNTQMVAQMTQFSSVSGIAEMNSSLRAITDQIATQTELLSNIASRLDGVATPPA